MNAPSIFMFEYKNQNYEVNRNICAVASDIFITIISYSLEVYLIMESLGKVMKFLLIVVFSCQM